VNIQLTGSLIFIFWGIILLSFSLLLPKFSNTVYTIKDVVFHAAQMLFGVDDWKADQYRWRNCGINLFPGKSSLVNKTDQRRSESRILPNKLPVLVRDPVCW